ncbi:MAG TPA: DUF222 domain-containing protein [Acidimicrobiia bacterium]
MAITEIDPIDSTDERPTEWLEAEICTLAGHIAAATCRFLLLVAEFDRRGGWRSWECLSAAHWLSWKCGISRRTAQDYVRVGRALEELPVMTAAFGAGRLSYSKVRAMTRVATSRTESDLVEVARHGTAAHIDRIVAGYCTVQRNVDPDRARAQLRRRGVWYETAEDGMVTITVRGAADATQAILRAIDAASTVLADPVDDPDAPGAARRFDALEHVARVYLEPDARAAPATELVVHADVETLAEQQPGRCEIEGGPSLTALALERLSCDAGVRLAIEREGSTIDVGRRTRSIPPALRRAIVDRDRGVCRFPGCTHCGRLQIHHRQPWSRGGRTEPANLLLVCLYHHKVLHEGGWHARGDANGCVTFVDPRGRPMPEVPALPARTDSNAIRRTHAATAVRIKADTIVPAWRAGERLDLDHAVTALWYLDPPDRN